MVNAHNGHRLLAESQNWRVVKYLEIWRHFLLNYLNLFQTNLRLTFNHFFMGPF